MRKAYTVGQINTYIKNMFQQDFVLNHIYIKGEVSNCKYHSSGHIYFSLKDETGTLACVMFAGNRKGLSFRMQEGQKVIALGAISVYDRDGKYQLYAKEIRLDGEGVLYQKFLQLKQELEEMGMFDACYKQPIPRYIKTLGVVTAPTGAAVQDIKNISLRRNPYLQIILYPALVQGEAAADSIAEGIAYLDAYGVDVIIVGRGGGSIEDLWAFNEEKVARAIFECRTPIISAVGHETDTTIADYLSDLRAPTPSAAAELAVMDRGLLEEQLYQARKQLEQLMRQKLLDEQKTIDTYKWKLTSLSPTYQLQQKQQYLSELQDKMNIYMNKAIGDKKAALSAYAQRMEGLSPIKRLNQGFSYTSDMNGHTITSVEQIEEGNCMKVYVSDGELHALVTKKMRKHL